MQKLFAWPRWPFCPFPLSAQVKITQGENQIAVSIDGKPYTTFFYGPEVAKPYLYPLRAAFGRGGDAVVPDGKGGGRIDRPPASALDVVRAFFGERLDYWNNEFSYEESNPKMRGKMGHIFVTKIDKVQSGAKTGEIDETSEWKQPDGVVVLNEDRKMIFHAGGPDRVMDFDFTLTAKTDVKFADAKDGVFGIRVASGLEEPGRSLRRNRSGPV